MLKADVAEHRLLRTLAIGLTEAILAKEGITLTPAVSDVFVEWLESKAAQAHPAVAELLAGLNAKDDDSTDLKQEQ